MAYISIWGTLQYMHGNDKAKGMWICIVMNNIFCVLWMGWAMCFLKVKPICLHSLKVNSNMLLFRYVSFFNPSKINSYFLRWYHSNDTELTAYNTKHKITRGNVMISSAAVYKPGLYDCGLNITVKALLSIIFLTVTYICDCNFRTWRCKSVKRRVRSSSSLTNWSSWCNLVKAGQGRGMDQRQKR